MHAQLSEILNLSDLSVEDNRSNKTLNQGFSMLLSPNVFESFAKERLELEEMKKQFNTKLDLIKKEEKKRLMELKKVEEDGFAVDVDREYHSHLKDIEAKELAAINKLQEKLNVQVNKLNDRIKELARGHQNIAILKESIKDANTNLKEAIKGIKTSFKDQKEMLLKSHKKERKGIIAIHKEKLQINGARTPKNIDITDTAMDEGSVESEDDEKDGDDTPDFTCEMIFAGGTRCKGTMHDTCNNRRCIYANKSICVDCWTKHAHVYN